MGDVVLWRFGREIQEVGLSWTARNVFLVPPGIYPKSRLRRGRRGLIQLVIRRGWWELVLSKKKVVKKKIETFGLRSGRKIGRLYEVVKLLGKGTEGEVYQIQESDTGIQRAAKLYFPHRDPKNRSTIWYAKKLNALRHCPIVLQYHHTEIIQVKGERVRCLISELCDGEQLEGWIGQHRGKRLDAFRALHVLYGLARGLESIHALGEYHADVHSQNILIRPKGIGFDLKLVDFYNWGRPTKYKHHQDIMDSVRVFYECLGGRKHYSKLPPEVKHICAALQQKLVIKRFPTMTRLRQFLEGFEWQTVL